MPKPSAPSTELNVDRATRREIMEQALGLAVASAKLSAPMLLPLPFLTSCGGSSQEEGTAPTGGQSQPEAVVLSTTAGEAIAGTPFEFRAGGLRLADPFVVELTYPSGSSEVVRTIRQRVDGTLTIATPLYINPQTGQIDSANFQVSVLQSQRRSNLLIFQATKIPERPVAEAALGDLTLAFLKFQIITLSKTLNRLEAIRLFPQNRVSTQGARDALRRRIASARRLHTIIEAASRGTPQVIRAADSGAGQAVEINSLTVDTIDRMLASFFIAAGYDQSVGIARALSGERSTPLFFSTVVAILNSPLRNGLGIVEGASATLNPDSDRTDKLVAWVGMAAGVVSVAALFGIVAPAAALVASVVGLAVAAYQVVDAVRNITAGNGGYGTAGLSGLSALSNAWDVGTLSGPGNPLVRTVVGALAGYAGGSLAPSPEDDWYESATTAIQESRNASPRQAFGEVTGNVSGQPALQNVGIFGESPFSQFTASTNPLGDFWLTLPLQVLGANYSTLLLGALDPISGLPTSSLSALDGSGLRSDEALRSPIIVYDVQAAPTPPPPPPPPNTGAGILLDFLSGAVTGQGHYSQPVANIAGVLEIIFLRDTPGLAPMTSLLGYYDSGSSPNQVGWGFRLDVFRVPEATGPQPTITIISLDLALFDSVGTSSIEIRPFAGLPQALRLNNPTPTTFSFGDPTRPGTVRPGFTVTTAGQFPGGGQVGAFRFRISNVRLRIVP